MKKNGLFIDMQPSLPWAFAQGLEEQTGTKWDVIAYINNDISGRGMDAIRYCKYFYYAFVIFIHRNQYDKIVAWQQFYGLLMAFYCRLFGVKKQFSLIVMTFIYKRKQGRLGNMYYSFIKYALHSKYIDKILVYSQQEVNDYATFFAIADKFAFVPLGIDRITDMQADRQLEQQKYILSVGRSNRDYPFLYEALKDTEYRVKILANAFSHPVVKNIELYTHVFDREMCHYLNNCFCVVIPLNDTKISSGQLVALQAMQLGKPIIVTESAGITDYIVHGANGFIIKKEKEALLEAPHDLYTDENLYRTIAQNARFDYEQKFTAKHLGVHVANILINTEEAKAFGS